MTVFPYHWFTESEYYRFQGLFVNNPEFPASYHDWVSFRENQVKTMHPGGEIQKTYLNYDKFMEFCTRTGVSPHDRVALIGFSVASRKVEGGDK